MSRPVEQMAGRAPKVRTRRRFSVSRIALYLMLSLGALIMIFPYIYEVLTSLKTYAETIAFPPPFFPARPQWGNYLNVLFTPAPLLRQIVNSVIVTAIRVVGQVLISAMAAYAVARLRFPFRRVVFMIFLSPLVVPSELFLLPQYQIMQALGLLDTLRALFLPGLFSAFGVFLLRQFFLSIPREVEEAARIDGANPGQIFLHVMLPLLRPALAALALLTMVSTWKELLWPLVVNSSPDKLTVSVGLASLIGEYVTHYETVMAGAVVASIIPIVIFLFGQRYFVRGLLVGAVK